jgi:hypothetical protein
MAYLLISLDFLKFSSFFAGLKGRASRAMTGKSLSNHRTAALVCVRATMGYLNS